MSKIRELIDLLRAIENVKESMNMTEYNRTFFMLGSQTRLNLTSEDIGIAIKRLEKAEYMENETYRN